MKQEKNNEKIDIDPEEYYAATTVIQNGWFPWIKSKITFMGMIKTKKAQDFYKPVIRKAGKYTRYYIKGSTIIEVIRLSDEGKLTI